MSLALRQAVDVLRTLPRLAKASFRREYKTLPWRSILGIVGAILYVVLPTDLIPDVIPVIGWIDDWAVVALVLKVLSADVARFHAWEASNAIAV